MSNSTTRFSDRVEDYVKYRPHYPEVILSYLRDLYAFGPGWVVADIGAGTGISTELFLRFGNKVFAVEPNREMRLKAEELLAAYPDFVSVDGTAEATGLGDSSVDLIVAGQAFHWFDPVGTRREFVRIARQGAVVEAAARPGAVVEGAARPGAVVALIWNERLILSAFEREYEDLILEFAGDYKTINHKNITDKQIGDFFRPQTFQLQVFENEQRFDFDGLKGRLLSSSYIPKEGPGYDAMMEALAALYKRHATGGQVRVGYETKVYTGVL
jgi:SAM-dependent methyltransferase